MDRSRTRDGSGARARDDSGFLGLQRSRPSRLIWRRGRSRSCCGWGWSWVHQGVRLEELQLVQALIDAAVIDQFFMGADLGDPALIDHDNLVGTAYGGK